MYTVKYILYLVLKYPVNILVYTIRIYRGFTTLSRICQMYEYRGVGDILYTVKVCTEYREYIYTVQGYKTNIVIIQGIHIHCTGI